MFASGVRRPEQRRSTQEEERGAAGKSAPSACDRNTRTRVHLFKKCYLSKVWTEVDLMCNICLDF